jgi:hypothetical protein
MSPWSMSWNWSWGPAGGIGDRYSFGDNLLWDLVRMGVILGGVFLVATIARIYVEQRRRTANLPRTQSARFISLLLAMIYIVPTEAWVMGSPATPRLIVAIFVVAFGIYGVRGIRKEQRAQPITRP